MKTQLHFRRSALMCCALFNVFGNGYASPAESTFPSTRCVSIHTKGKPEAPTGDCVGRPSQQCIEGKILSGVLKGSFVFEAEEVVEGAGLTPDGSDVLSFRYTQTIQTKRGELVLDGLGIGSPSGQLFGSVHRFRSGTGLFARTSHIKLSKISSTDPENTGSGYRGEICFFRR